jgi:mycothiol synthase
MLNTLTMRPYSGETDLPLIVDLINHCEAIDQVDGGTSINELRTQLNAPNFDKTRDLCLWQDADGQLVAFGRLWIKEDDQVVDGFLGFRVHPAARRSGLEKQVIAWAEARMREVGQQKRCPSLLRCGARQNQSDRIAVIESCGFTPVRYFYTMTRSLNLPIAQPQLPPGFTIQHMSEADAEKWVDLYNQTFIDHWNHHPITVEEFKHDLTDPDYRSELDLVAIAPDGTFAALCYCEIDFEQNALKERSEGWVGCLGTRRGFRRLGLARAMLLAGLHQLKAQGIETAKLGVDADNPLGAKQLYESVGFEKLFTRMVFSKDIA